MHTDCLTVIRFVNDPACTGPENMARDETLLNRVGSGTSPPTLRLYAWSEPTISLGYFQRYADYEALPPPAGDLPVVRRMTGGGAILHDLELTYSMTLPVTHSLLADGPTRLYELVHDAVMDCLRRWGLNPAPCGTSDDSGAAKGPFFCFARRHRFDVLIGADKIAGSAQRRTKTAVLQHGSIVIANRFDQHPSAHLAGPPDPTLTELRTMLPKALGTVMGVDIEPQPWSADESTNAESLIGKYAGDQWTKRT